MTARLAEEARKVYERLEKGGVPKYIRHRNMIALHEMLERTGGIESEFKYEYWYYVEDADGNLMKEAHYFDGKRIGCDKKMHEVAKPRGTIKSFDTPMCKLCRVYYDGFFNGRSQEREFRL